MNNVSIPSIHASIEEKVRQLIENLIPPYQMTRIYRLP